MVILSKKRIMIVISFVFISIFTYFLGVNKKEKTIQTVSLPVSGKVEILDAGHGRGRCTEQSLIMETLKRIRT